MLRLPTGICLFICLVCATQTGCLLNHSNHTVIRQGEPLQRLTFESESSRSAFESHVERAIESDSNDSRSSFGVPFIVGLKRSSKTSETAIRNDAGTRLDINGDRVISEYEMSLLR